MVSHDERKACNLDTGQAADCQKGWFDKLLPSRM